MIEDDGTIDIKRDEYKKAKIEREEYKEIIEKDEIPTFFPTYRITGYLYPVPIIITVIIAGFLAYLTYVIAGIQVEGGYVSESEYGATAGLINGIIFTVLAGISAFIMIFFVKKYGINVLKVIFGGTFAFICFFLTLFYGSIVIYLIFINLPPFENIVDLYNLISLYVLPICIGIFTIFIIYRYLFKESLKTKNFVVLYIGILIGATMGVVMPFWTTIAILIGISLWDIFAVKSKWGPIKEMIDIASGVKNGEKELSEEEIEEKIRRGEIIYDTSKLEIGIGDLAFYSMLTSSALIQTGELLVMTFTAIAVIIGTGITILGLKRNKILPGLPISIFLGIATMLGSWWLIVFIKGF
ncbi:MAG: hypothetical protein ACTSVV_10145 [Promethearchaeota archaeon]